MRVSQAYLDFIRYSIYNTGDVPPNYKEIDWNDFLNYCNRQGIIGLVFEGMQKAELRIQPNLLYHWISYSESIRAQNQVVNKRICEITNFFDEKGLRSCIFKGQLNGRMYPNPSLRTPGDIDIWVEGNREDIIKTVISITPNAHYSLHHVKFPIFKDVSVEVHYRPIFMSNWKADKKLQRYVRSIEGQQFSNKVLLNNKTVGSLTDDFNIIYQMLHMYHHFFSSRNCFKQFIDYFMLLKKIEGHCDKNELRNLFAQYGVKKYATGVMWIMKERLGLEEHCLIVEPSEKIGRLIMNESTHFGKHVSGKARKVLGHLWSNLRILTQFPQEVLISPLFLIWHQWWKFEEKRSIKE